MLPPVVQEYIPVQEHMVNALEILAKIWEEQGTGDVG